MKSKNSLLRFFTRNSFNRYRIEWTAWRVILAIILWKGVIIWGVLFLLYLLITWYGGVLFNTLIRLHPKLKLLLDEDVVLQSNIFLTFNLLIALTLLLEKNFTNEFLFGFICLLIFALFVAISFFEIYTKAGKTQFMIFVAISSVLLLLANQTMVIVGFFSIFLLLIYAFLFTLRVSFI